MYLLVTYRCKSKKVRNVHQCALRREKQDIHTLRTRNDALPTLLFTTSAPRIGPEIWKTRETRLDVVGEQRDRHRLCTVNLNMQTRGIWFCGRTRAAGRIYSPKLNRDRVALGSRVVNKFIHN